MIKGLLENLQSQQKSSKKQTKKSQEKSIIKGSEIVIKNQSKDWKEFPKSKLRLLNEEPVESLSPWKRNFNKKDKTNSKPKSPYTIKKD